MYRGHFPPIIIFGLLSLTAPFWLCLRSWWGPRFVTRTLIWAVLLHPVALYCFNIILAWFGLHDLDDNRWILPSLALTVIGLAIQLLAAIVYLLRIHIGHPNFARSNFAGSFLFLPQTRWPLPVDAIAIGTLLILYPGEPLPFPPIDFIPHVPTINWPPMTHQALYTAWAYCALIALTFLNGGYLLCTIQGEQPSQRTKPIKRTTTKLVAAAKPSRETLSDILSRRPSDLQKIANPDAS